MHTIRSDHFIAMCHRPHPFLSLPEDITLVSKIAEKMNKRSNVNNVRSIT